MSTAQHTPGPWKAFNKDGKHVQADEWSTDCEGAASSTHAPIKAGTEVVALVVASSRRWPDLHDIAPNCRLIATAPELLSELQKAHELIVLMLNELTPAAKSRFMAKADRAGLIVEGATRFHERATVIAKATGSAA